MKNKIVSSFIWRFLERCSSQGVNLIVSIVLARELGPEAYGVITLANVFIVILQVFVEKGFGTALVQKKEADDYDFSSVFFFNFAMCVVLYMLLFLTAPFIAVYYGFDELTPIIRALGIVLISSGLRNVQQAYVSRNLLFKKFFFATVISTICGGSIGIFMAYYGFGAWALVAQTLVNELVGTLILWITVRWRPKLLFSRERLLILTKFGWKLLVSSLIDTVYNKLRDLIIGKRYTTNDLAFYNKGNQLPGVLVINICTAIDSVLFPAIAKVQDDRDRVKDLTRKSIQLSTFIIMPMMIGVTVCAEPIIRLLLTETWLPCVPYLRIACVTYAFYMIHTANLNAITAIGRSDIFLKLEVLKKAIGILTIILTIKYSPYVLACSGIFSAFVSLIINCYPNKKLLSYGFMEQMKDIFPSTMIACLMGCIVGLFNFLDVSDILKLLIQVTTGVIVYVLLSKVFKLWGLDYLCQVVRKKDNHD